MNWFPKKKIVVPVDFSDESFAALETALQITDEPSGIHVIHVLPEMSAADPGVVWQQISDESRRQHTLEAFRERLQGEPYQQLKFEVEFGDPGYRITQYAEKNGAELIVLASHGRTGISRLLIGSVAERVIRLAHCPVLVLRQ